MKFKIKTDVEINGSHKVNMVFIEMPIRTPDFRDYIKQLRETICGTWGYSTSTYSGLKDGKYVSGIYVFVDDETTLTKLKLSFGDKMTIITSWPTGIKFIVFWEEDHD